MGRRRNIYDVLAEILSDQITWDASGPPPLSAEPTDALPGSNQKVLVMRRRALRRENLFHPLDTKIQAAAEAKDFDALMEVAC